MTACRRITSGQFPEQVGTNKLTERARYRRGILNDAWWEMIPRWLAILFSLYQSVSGK
jgi:hypothetical protein